ncbi:MAG: transketolase [Patescibacteria group bacterium]|mgnify:FL=1
MSTKILKEICKSIRHDILVSITEAGSGHVTSCLSAVELMTTLYFGGFLKLDITDPKNLINDRVIFSKGHAAPLLYSILHRAQAISETELMSLRKFGSDLEGHPIPHSPLIDVATGSLGQGLSFGLGMAIGIELKIKNLELRIEREPKVFVLLGDSEMAEGQVWEAIQITSHHKLNNLIGIIDVNRLGQTNETMDGWNIKNIERKIKAFGWNTIRVEDGHNLKQIIKAFKQLDVKNDKPTMIIAKTIKGKGISFLENKKGWHGKALNKEKLKLALKELGKININIRGNIKKPNVKSQITNIKSITNNKFSASDYEPYKNISTREAYGNAITSLGKNNQKIVVLDAEMSNSTFTNKFKKAIPDKFFEMFIAEQNMISTGVGLSKLGLIPFVSSFSAFLTRGFDQLRIAQYSCANLKIVGSHGGVSVGADGATQMGLEDISMMKSILNSTVFYPSDAISTEKLTQIMADNFGIFYLRTSRGEMPVIYSVQEEFKIGGSKVHNVLKVTKVNKVKALIIANGVTLHESLKAQKELTKLGIETIVLDTYSVKPIDTITIKQLTNNCCNVIVVEDHYPDGGIGDTVAKLIVEQNLNVKNFTHLCVKKIPRSGKPDELLRFEEIDSQAIIRAVKKLLINK